MYAFLRTADDIADNEAIPINLRLKLLLEMEGKLHRCYRDDAVEPIFIALADTVRRVSIPIECFLDLLNAFKVDLFKSRYGTFEELIEYCRFSANPVGDMVLRLWQYDRHPEYDIMKKASDEICTGLQLTNHWQDIFIDRRKGRLYVPLEDMTRFEYTLEEWERELVNSAFRSLMEFECIRARGFFERGAELLTRLRRPHRIHIGLVQRGGMRILDKLSSCRYDVLTARPSLNSFDVLKILWATLFGVKES